MATVRESIFAKYVDGLRAAVRSHPEINERDIATLAEFVRDIILSVGQLQNFFALPWNRVSQDAPTESSVDSVVGVFRQFAIADAGSRPSTQNERETFVNTRNFVALHNVPQEYMDTMLAKKIIVTTASLTAKIAHRANTRASLLSLLGILASQIDAVAAIQSAIEMVEEIPNAKVIVYTRVVVPTTPPKLFTLLRGRGAQSIKQGTLYMAYDAGDVLLVIMQYIIDHVMYLQMMRQRIEGMRTDVALLPGK